MSRENQQNFSMTQTVKDGFSMEFDDLLDNGSGTRRLDKWIHQNVNLTKHDDNLSVPFYTTGDSIEPIWSLAKDNFTKIRLFTYSEKEKAKVTAFGEESPIRTFEKTELLAIARALFEKCQRKDD